MSSPDSLPILRLELSGMRQAIMMAFTARQASIDAEVQAAVDAFCTPENLRGVIDRCVANEIESAIRREVERFYSSGDGRKAIAEIVAKNLKGRGAE